MSGVPPARRRTGGRSSLVRNTTGSSVPILLGYVFSFIVAPLMLSRLGLAAFGVWAVTGSLAAYAALSDLGMRRALGRFIALYDTGGDDRAVRECVGLGISIMTVVGTLMAITAVFAAPLLQRSLGVLSVEDMRVTLLCSVVISMSWGFSSVFNSMNTGLRRMVPAGIATTTALVLNFLFSVGALLVSTELVTYAIANAAAGVLGVGASFVAMWYVWRSFPIAIPSRRVIRDVLSYSLKAQVHGISGIVNMQTGKLILAFFVSVEATAVYEIATRVTRAVKGVALQTISAMVPTATAHIVEHGRESIPAWYRHYNRRVAALALPLFLLASLTAPFLLVAWLGNLPEKSAVVISVLCLAYAVSITIEVGMTTSNADGNPGMVALNSAMTAALNVLLMVALAPLFGFWGILAGTALAVTIGAAIFVVRFHRRYKIPFADYFRSVGPPAALAFGLLAPFLVLPLFGDFVLDSRLASVSVVASVATIYGLTYWAAASRLGYLPEKLSLRRARIRQIA